MLSGGFGIVYLTTNKELAKKTPSMPRFFALKTFRQEIYQGPTTFDDFEREAYVWLRLGKHDCIVHAFFLQKCDGMPFVVSEGIVNEHNPNTLRGWINASIQPANEEQVFLHWRRVIAFGIQICIGGMEFASLMGINCHCDLKPENIFLTDEGTVKIGDWGLSALTNAALVQCINASSGSCFPYSREKFASKAAGGTIPYMAPELLKGMSPDVTSDIYAFGSVLYELLALRRPFQASTVEEWVEAHLSVAPMSLARLMTGIPKSLDELVLRCLAKAPEDRPESFASLKISLNEIARAETGKGFSQEFLQATSHGMPETNFERMQRAGALHQLGAEDDAQRLMSQRLAPEEANRPHIFLWDDEDYDAPAGMRFGKYRIGFPAEIVRSSEEKTKDCPNDPNAWSGLGSTYYLAGRFSDARSAYRHAMCLAPDRQKEFEIEIACIDKAEVENCMELCTWYELKGDYMEALRACLRGLDIDQTDAKLWYNLGAVKLRLSDLAGAEEALAKATVLDPNLVQPLNSLGAVRMQLGQLDGAIECFDKAIALDPAAKKAWLNRSTALSMLGKRNEAIQSVKKALEIDSDYELARSALDKYLKDA